MGKNDTKSEANTTTTTTSTTNIRDIGLSGADAVEAIRHITGGNIALSNALTNGITDVSKLSQTIQLDVNDKAYRTIGDILGTVGKSIDAQNSAAQSANALIGGLGQRAISNPSVDNSEVLKYGLIAAAVVGTLAIIYRN